MDNNPQGQIEIERKRTIFSSLNPRENFKVFIASIFILLGIIGLGAFSSGNNGDTIDSGKGNEAFSATSDNTVVYGYWTDRNSIIGAFDLSTGRAYNIATLDIKVKKATITSPDSVVFINKTDESDHGKEIASYNFRTKSTNALFQADDGFGIDDYVISPNKKLVADWEIQKPANASGLIGGRSRVYTFDFNNPAQKNLIYDEEITEGIPMHYPVGITDSGEVFLDGFIANTAAGWSNGMSYSNISGTQKQNIGTMGQGTYSTQPVMSSDGKYIAFAGYDGSLGAGTQVDESGFKIAHINPNTIEILDTSTKERRKLSDLSNADRYTSVSWDKNSKNLIFTITSKEADKNGYYTYDILGERFNKIEVGEDDSIVSSLSGTQFLTGKTGESSSAIGNLGPKYSSGFGTFSVFDTSGKSTTLDTGVPMAQYIDILPSGYFVESSLNLALESDEDENKENKKLQLYTFALKPSLAPKREEQQSKPKTEAKPSCIGTYPVPDYCVLCPETAKAQCTSLMGQRTAQNAVQWQKCYLAAKDVLDKSGVCYDSPLYLYGKPGTKIDIQIGTKITKPIPYSDGSYSVVLGEKGEFKIDGKNYSSIGFGYAPAIEMPKMTYGRVVRKEDVEETIEEYGKKLGLNEKEILDLKNSIKFTYPYVWVSFYNDEISKKILPISFSPAPDVYRNIVFYFKLLDAPMSIPEPKFAPIPQRKGFTAVEVSHTIE